MKKLLLTTVMALLSVFSLNAANQNIANLITSSDWSTIFPNRAQAGHKQGATDDYYSYAKFSAAVDEISNYTVTFSPGPGGQGTSVAVAKAGGSSWTYVITSSSWSGANYTVDYSTFCNTGNDANDKRELAAFLANITKETTGGWVDPDPTKSAANQPTGSHGSWGLHWLRELQPGADASIKPSNCYTTGSTIDYQPAAGKCYYGRGPIQISYFYNYGNFSEFLYNNTSLVSNPDLLEQNGELAFLSAIWFWMTPQCPKPSCHQVMQEIYNESATSYSSAKMSKKGFLHTVNIINGDVECRGANAKPLLRSKLYKYYMSLIGFTSQEISNEDLGDYSTLCNVGGTMVKYTSCDFQNVVVNNCSTPGLGADKELKSGTTSLDANVTLKTGETIAWYKDGVLINGATSTTYTATATGTYKAVVTGANCTKEDVIVISAEGSGPVCSTPALGKDTTLIGGSATLNANITLQSGETIAWYKDGVQIWGQSGTTYTATSVGTYKAVVTGTGCTAEDEIVISAEVIVCSQPALGSDVTFNGTSALLDANITLKSGETIAWYKDGTIIWGATTTTYTAAAVGTYKAVVTGSGCTNEDEVVVALVTCSTPTLGDDVSLCSGKSLTLDSKVTLATGETIKWYKDGNEITGATGTTYNASATGTYKAQVSGPSNCTRVDSMNVTNGGSQKLQISASNNATFCSIGNPSSVTLTVTGGAGTYNFYNDSTGQTPISTGASLVVDQSLVSDGSTKTFFVQEPSGPPVTVGATTPYTSGAWANLSTNQNWNNYRVVLNTLSKVTLESVDFVFYQNHTSHTFVITVYDYGTDNVVKTKTVQLNANNLAYVAGSTYPLNKVQLGLELPAGNYEVSFIGSTFTFHIVQSGIDYTDAKFSSQGIAEIKGVNQPGSWNYPSVNPSHLGAYNWVFKSGSAGACGRASIDVNAYCGIGTNVKELSENGIVVYPNPASDVLNIDLGGVDAANGYIELYDAIGQVVRSQSVSAASGNIIQLETADLNDGLYVVKVLAEGKNYTTRVVITK